MPRHRVPPGFSSPGIRTETFLQPVQN
jgi:hypothetical protein